MSVQTHDRPGWMSSILPPVFFTSAALILAFVIFAMTASGFAENIFSTTMSWVTETFGWFYLMAVTIFVIFAVGLAVSPFGKIKLGTDESQPDFGYLAWFAMLFSAGMGIGLMFFGVAEPMFHYLGPPMGEGQTMEAARQAMVISFFHWGFHAWAIYAVVGMALAYFAYRHKLPLSIRSALYPLLGNRIYGPIGHAVDIFAVLGTMFGVATSLGFGVAQVNSGLAYLFGTPNTVWVQVGLIAIITAFATASVVSGLDKGIKRISELNLILAAGLVLFVLAAGPTLFLLEATFQNIGEYIAALPDITFNSYAYEPAGGDAQSWMGSWTLFYWAWWIAWSPFVGMFIARVSRGRSIREFVTGVLLVPVGFTFLWMTVFGNTAIFLDQGAAAGAISEAVNADYSTALFALLDQMPFGFIAALVATVLVITFFVTSSDSGSLVIDIITSGGKDDPAVWQRVFWAVTEGVVAAGLLLAGGLGALQTASIVAALPFTAILLIVCWGLLRALQMEGKRQDALQVPATVQIQGAHVPWEQRLKAILNHPTRERGQAFLDEVATPALESVAQELRQHGLEVETARENGDVTLTAYHGGHREFVYSVGLKAYRTPSFALDALHDTSRKHHDLYYRAEVHLLEGSQHYDIMGFTREQVIADVLSQYDRHMHYMQLSPEAVTAPG